jgi:hypothetical protein
MTDQNESSCIYVSSRGILKSCDIYEECPKSSFRYLSKRDWSLVRHGQTIYICGFAIGTFLNEALPFIKAPFILVSGDCDATMPLQVLPEKILQKFLQDKRLIAWFSQNLAIKHPKLHPIPIGMDYHTLAQPYSHPWGPPASPVVQENMIDTIRNSSPSLIQRKLKIYGNFHFNLANRQYSGDRKAALQDIPSELIEYQVKELPREETWKAAAQYVFLASPAGGGLDCHRTWEALALGCIPIIKSLELTETMFEGLPILIIKSWKDINSELLVNTLNRFSIQASWPPEPLKLSFWMNKMRQLSTSF